MAIFKKHTDPISDRSKALKAEIAALEDEIRQLSSKIVNGSDHPRVHSGAPSGRLPTAETAPAPVHADTRPPVFERLDNNKVAGPPEPSVFAGAEANLGIGSNGSGKGWRRLASFFHRPPASNPKLVSYLAAGSIKGLRPLRYEKRVARNRFLALTALLLLLLWGIYAAFVRIY